MKKKKTILETFDHSTKPEFSLPIRVGFIILQDRVLNTKQFQKLIRAMNAHLIYYSVTEPESEGGDKYTQFLVYCDEFDILTNRF